MRSNETLKAGVVTDAPLLEHGRDVNPAAFVQAVKDAERAGGAAIMLRLLLDGEADETVTRSVVAALGANGQQLVDAYLAARVELTKTLQANLQRCRDLVKQQLGNLLPKSLAGDDSGRDVFPRVMDVNSASLLEDGTIWGFLRVNTRKNCFDSREFTWKDGEIQIRNEQDVY